MSHNLTGKDKSARIALPYHEKVGKTRKKWAIIAGVGLLVVAGLVGAAGYWKEWSAPLRPVHSAHAAWEHDCSSCHDTLKPTNSSNALSGWLSNHGKTSDAKCQACHMGEETQQAHHKEMQNIPVKAATCAACHTEHQGRSAFISRVADAKCTCCHDAKVSTHAKDGTTVFASYITSFDGPRKKDDVTGDEKGGHPEFKIGKKGERVELSKAKDPGKLRFNHQMHLAKGIIGNWTFERIPEKDGMRKRYKDMQGPDTKDTDSIQLDCASCHAMSASDDKRKTGPVRSSGDYVLPVTYDQHCKACHPLTFSPAQGVENTEIPHHLQPEQMSEFLSGVFARTVVKEGAGSPKLKKLFDDFPLPGDNLKREDRLRAVIKGVSDKATDRRLDEKPVWEKQMDQAERLSTCMLCHHKEPKSGKIITPNVPEVWLPHAKFSHQAHGTVQCAECHGGEGKDSKSRGDEPRTTPVTSVYNSEKADDVLLPPLNNCLKCHSTAKTVSGKKQGGVRHDCVTCHSYHHGDDPLAGRGTKERGIKKRMTIDELLSR